MLSKTPFTVLCTFILITSCSHHTYPQEPVLQTQSLKTICKAIYKSTKEIHEDCTTKAKQDWDAKGMIAIPKFIVKTLVSPISMPVAFTIYTRDNLKQEKAEKLIKENIFRSQNLDFLQKKLKALKTNKSIPTLADQKNMENLYHNIENESQYYFTETSKTLYFIKEITSQNLQRLQTEDINHLLLSKRTRKHLQEAKSSLDAYNRKSTKLNKKLAELNTLKLNRFLTKKEEESIEKLENELIETEKSLKNDLTRKIEIDMEIITLAYHRSDDTLIEILDDINQTAQFINQNHAYKKEE